MDEYINKTKFEELMRKKARNSFDLYYADKSKRYHAKAIGYTIAADEAHVFPASDVQPINQRISCKEISLKVYFYDDNGYEVFTRIYHVESVPYLIKVLFETLFTNSNVYSYYIEKVDTE